MGRTSVGGILVLGLGLLDILSLINKWKEEVILCVGDWHRTVYRKAALTLAI